MKSGAPHNFLKRMCACAGTAGTIVDVQATSRLRNRKDARYGTDDWLPRLPE